MSCIAEVTRECGLVSFRFLDLDSLFCIIVATTLFFVLPVTYCLLGSVAFRATFLGLGSILAVLTKDMPQEFNWSKEIAACIYTSAVILFIGIPLGFALTDSASMVVLLKGLTIVIAYTTVTTIIHFDSLKRIAFGKGPREQTKTSHTIRSKTSGSTV